MKRTTRQYITVALLCIIVIGGAAIITSFIYTKQIREEYDYQLAKMNQEKEENQRVAYTPINEIQSGEMITENNLIKKTVYSSQPQDIYMTEEGIGKVALLDIPAGAHIQENMLTENAISSELREVEYDVIQINTNIITNDMVDIRIVYPNGEDFTILSKKAIKRQDADTYGCFLWLAEEEILRMQSAVIDAYLYTGAYLYTSKYIEPNIQEPSVVNYQPSVEAINLIIENPNIIHTATNELSITARKALENRLTRSLHRDVTVKQWNLEDDYIYQQYNMITKNPVDTYSNPKNELDTNKDVAEDQLNEDKHIIDTLQKDNNAEDSIEFYSPELGKKNESQNMREDLSKNENRINKINKEINQEYGNDIFVITEG